MKTGSRLISNMRAFRKLQNECTSGQVLPPSRVRFDGESGSLWATTDGASTTISYSLLRQGLSQSQLQWLLQWISCAKFLELSLDLTSLRGRPLYPPLLQPNRVLTWQEISILNV